MFQFSDIFATKKTVLLKLRAASEQRAKCIINFLINVFCLAEKTTTDVLAKLPREKT